MKSRLPAVLVSGGALMVAVSVFAHPYGMVKAQISRAPFAAETPMDPEVKHIFERSCQNCHSEETAWPWYSYIAPIGWLVEKDVQQGRQHMDLSRWNEYSSDQQRNLFSRMAAEVRSRQMPLPRYTLLHPGARLSEQEITKIVEWTRAQRRPADRRGD